MALVLFTGGARSGKSSAAQALALRRWREGVDVTVAVFGRSAGADAEFARRIAAHRATRPLEWATLEAEDAESWRAAVPAGTLLVADCLGTLLGRAMEDVWPAGDGPELAAADALALPAGFETAARERFDRSVRWLLEREGDTIVVTNEVGSGLVPAWASGRFFGDELGRANRTLVSGADASYLCVAGRLVDLAALPVMPVWPRD